MPDSGSGSEYAYYSYEELHDLRRLCENYRGSGFHRQSEDRRHAGERDENNRVMLKKVREELNFRLEAREAREAKREERERNRETREQARAAERQASKIRSKLNAYFRRTKVADPPAITERNGVLSWTHNGRQYIAHYVPAIDTLQVQIMVAEGTLDATIIGGRHYLPANTGQQIHAAHVAERKSQQKLAPKPVAANPERRFANHSTIELKELLRYNQEQLAQKRPHPPHMVSEERRLANEQTYREDQTVQAIIAELRLRELSDDEISNLSATKKRPEPATPATPAPQPAQVRQPPKSTTADQALQAYCAKTGTAYPPERATKGVRTTDLGRVYLSWIHHRHEFAGIYTQATGMLEVWVRVAHGTPGATISNNVPYLPANDTHQLHEAYAAEARVTQAPTPVGAAMTSAIRAVHTYLQQVGAPLPNDMMARPGRNEFTWTHADRSFIAAYQSGDKQTAPRLRVWISVANTTANAQIIEGTHYLPANDIHEIRYAQVLEARGRNRR